VPQPAATARAEARAEARAAALAAHDPESLARAQSLARLAVRDHAPAARTRIDACLGRSRTGPDVAACLDPGATAVDELAPWSPWHER